MRLYACSGNRGKLGEFVEAARTLSLAGLTITSLPGLEHIAAPEETGATFEDNACLKALYYSQFTPEYVFADDSGLVVDALGGAPGVYSARFAGPQAKDWENNELLLRRLKNESDRSARFVCVIALARAGRLISMSRGEVEGEILCEPRGSLGFGYDPLFYCTAAQAGFGELAPDAKFSFSHRGNAVRALLPSLQGLA